MKIIIAQGNPELKYNATRHNVGFMALDSFVKTNNLTFVSKPKFYAHIAEATFGTEKILFIKPTTYYNETGKSARAIVDFYKLDPATDVLAIHDDLALPFGTLRTREKGSDAGNNGIKSLNAHLGPEYARLRIGIYSELRDKVPDVDFVLSKFSANEQKILEQKIIPACNTIIEEFISDSLESASHKIDTQDQ